MKEHNKEKKYKNTEYIRADKKKNGINIKREHHKQTKIIKASLSDRRETKRGVGGWGE